MSIGYSAPNGAVRQALQQAYDHGVVVIASAGNSGAPAGTSDRNSRRRNPSPPTIPA